MPDDKVQSVVDRNYERQILYPIYQSYGTRIVALQSIAFNCLHDIDPLLPFGTHTNSRRLIYVVTQSVVNVPVVFVLRCYYVYHPIRFWLLSCSALLQVYRLPVLKLPGLKDLACVITQCLHSLEGI